MASSMKRMIEELGRNVEALAGSKIKDKVMEGSQNLGPEAEGRQAALWVKRAVDRLDKLADKKTCFAVMEKCGINCARFNSGVMKGAMSRRIKFSTLEAFLEAEVKKPLKGTKLERRGQVLILFLSPSILLRGDEMLLRPGPRFAGEGGDLSDLLPLFQGLRPDLVGSCPGPTGEG